MVIFLVNSRYIDPSITAPGVCGGGGHRTVQCGCTKVSFNEILGVKGYWSGTLCEPTTLNDCGVYVGTYEQGFRV
jgi:hypothetical protein